MRDLNFSGLGITSLLPLVGVILANKRMKRLFLRVCLSACVVHFSER